MLVALVWLIVTVKGLDAKVTGLDAKVTGLDAKVANLAHRTLRFLRGRWPSMSTARAKTSRR